MITGTALAEFGTGDIQLGITINECGTGILGYRNKEEGPIGEYDNDGEWNTGDTQVMMTFTKTESIDVVINMLKEVKALMLEQMQK